jgi:hypothetical protein
MESYIAPILFEGTLFESISAWFLVYLTTLSEAYVM